MKLKDITDIFFDLDHTLWDFDKNSALTFNKIFNLNQLDINLNEFLRHYEPINLKYWKLYREEKIEKEALRFERLNEAFKAINFHVQDNIINKLSEDYITYLTTYNYLFDDTFEILNYLSSNYSLHIITNGFQEVQHGKLTKSKINHYFKTVTNSEMVGVKKPNPKIFNYALQKANTNAKNSLMIGDSYEADILGALNIGMRTVFFDLKNTSLHNTTKKINKLIDLKGFL